MRYLYDIQGNLKLVTDALGRVAFNYVYDLKPKAGEEDSGANVLWMEHIDSGEKTAVFDAAFKNIELNDAKGAQVLNAYDGLQRPVKMWAKDIASEAVTLRQQLFYGDSAGLTNPEETNHLGQLYRHMDEAGRVIFNAYDFKGNLLQKQRSVVADSEIMAMFSGPPSGWDVPTYRVDWDNPPTLEGTYVTDMQYDALNRITQLVYPKDVDDERKVLLPSYNKAGALESVELDSDKYVTHIAYNAKGQRILIAYANTVMTRYAYNNQTFRLMRQRSETYTQTGYSFESDGSVKQDTAYVYDLHGNITETTDKTTGCGIGGTNTLDRDFDYDALYRLLQATGRENTPTITSIWDDSYRSADNNVTTGYTQNYQYDKMGNIQQLQHIGYANFTRNFTYFSNTNKLQNIQVGIPNFPLTYDNNGNQITETSRRFFQWDYADRLRSFKIQSGTSEPTQHAHYLYDAAGVRIKKLVRVQGGSYTSTIYIDGLFEFKTNGTDEQNTLHVMDDQSRIATIRLGDDFGDTTPTVKYNLEDHLGSSTLQLKANGANISSEEYYPFGETSFGSYAKKRYKYCGKERDEESGLYYYGARYYNAWTGRFVSVDPLAADYPFYTPYNYAGNKPINKIDADGLAETEPRPFAQLFRNNKGSISASIFTNKYTFQNRNPFTAGAVKGSLTLPKLNPAIPEKINHYENMSKVTSSFSDESIAAISPVAGGIIVLADFYVQVQKFGAHSALDEFKQSYQQASTKIDAANLSIETGLWIMKSFDVASKSGLFKGTEAETMNSDFNMDVANYALMRLAGYDDLIDEQKFVDKPNNMSPEAYREVISKTFNILIKDIVNDKESSKPKTIISTLGDVKVFSVNLPISQQKYENQPIEHKNNHVPK